MNFLKALSIKGQKQKNIAQHLAMPSPQEMGAIYVLPLSSPTWDGYTPLAPAPSKGCLHSPPPPQPPNPPSSPTSHENLPVSLMTSWVPLPSLFLPGKLSQLSQHHPFLAFFLALPLLLLSTLPPKPGSSLGSWADVPGPLARYSLPTWAAGTLASIAT